MIVSFAAVVWARHAMLLHSPHFVTAVSCSSEQQEHLWLMKNRIEKIKQLSFLFRA